MGKKIIKLIATILIIIPLILGLMVAGLRYIEKRTLFYPTRSTDIYPDRLGLNFEEVFFYSSDKVKLYGWFIPSKKARYTILFCHGNAGNISHRVEKVKFFNQLGCNVFVFDYRGYGKSKGSPSENGLYRDARSAYAYLLNKGINANSIIGYGESIGGAVVTDLASENKLAGFILDSTFSNVEDIVKLSYHYIPSWAFSSKFNSIYKIKSINMPKLIIHSINDEIVPFELSRKIYNASPEPKDFLQIRGGHNSCFYESEEILRAKVLGFLSSLE